MMMVMAADRLRQILDVRELSAFRRRGEVGGELVQLARGGGVALRLRGLRRALQIGGDLLGGLLVRRWIRLLQLLERRQQLREG